MFQHGIHDDEQFAHAGGKGHLAGFALGSEPLVEVPDHWVAARCRHGRHIQRTPDLGTPTPDDAFTLVFAAVPVEGRYPYQGSDFFPVQRTQLWQLRQQGRAGHHAHAGYRLQQVVLVPPDGRGAQRMGQVDAELGNAFVQPGDVLLEAGPLPCRSTLQAQFLLHPHVDELTSARQQLAQGAGVFIRQGPDLGADGLGEGCQDQGVDAVRLGQASTALA